MKKRIDNKECCKGCKYNGQIKLEQGKIFQACRKIAPNYDETWGTCFDYEKEKIKEVQISIFD